jgi:hypothetical protein
MDAIENRTTSLKNVNKQWNILLTSLSNHLYGKTRSKKLGLVGVLIIDEDQVVVACVLSLQEVGILISLK